MEFLLTFISSLGVSAAGLSLLWLWKRNKLKSAHGAFGAIALAFTVFQFVITADPASASLVREMVIDLFALAAISLNTYSSCYTHINIGVNRRTTDSKNYTYFHKERRQTPATALHMKHH